MIRIRHRACCLALSALSALSVLLALGATSSLAAPQATQPSTAAPWLQARQWANQPDGCPRAEPLLREVLAAEPDPSVTPYAAMLLGRCLARAGQAAEAAPWLRQASDAAAPEWVNIRQEASLLLAAAYASGQPGLPRDTHQAIEYYLRGNAWFEAASLMESAGWANDPTIELLLNQGGAAGKARLVQRMRQRNDNVYEIERKLWEIYSLAMTAAQQPLRQSAALDLARLALTRHDPINQLVALSLSDEAGEAAREVHQQALRKIPWQWVEPRSNASPSRPHAAIDKRPANAQPEGVHAALLAWQVWGQVMDAHWLPLRSGDAHDWLLVGYAGQINHSTVASPDVSSTRSDDEGFKLAWVRVTPQQTTTDDAEANRPLVRVISAASTDAPLACDLPREEDTSASGFKDVMPQARLRQLGNHQVLEIKLSRTEGYAGGGGSFEATAWLRTDGEPAMPPVVCALTGLSLMLAGSWHPDGTREHEEIDAQWQLQAVQPQQQAGAARNDAWPDLLLTPTPGSRRQRTSVWNTRRGRMRYENHSAARPAGPALRWRWDHAAARYTLADQAAGPRPPKPAPAPSESKPD